MVSPAPSEIEERTSYFEDWLLELSTTEERKTVVDEESAREFIRRSFDKDSSLSNLREGMDQSTSTYEKLTRSGYIQELIKENTGLTTPKLIKKPVAKEKVEITRSVSIAKIVSKKERGVRKAVIKRIYTPEIQRTTGYELFTDKRGRTRYRNTKTGRFASYTSLIRAADPIIKADPAKVEEIERLIRLEKQDGFR